MGKYAGVFEQSEVTRLSDLEGLTAEDLAEIGVQDPSDLGLIADAVASMGTKEGTVPIGHFFGGSALPPEEPPKPKARRRGWWGGGTERAVLPFSKSVPGAPSFGVDCFTVKNPALKNYFLTHFHADHYGGLQRGFCHGMIYCTEVTARLVRLKIGVDERYITTLPMDTPTVIEGCFVTLTDANHCPGAAMIVFETNDGRKHLHCGDCRYRPEFESRRLLTRGHFDTLFLDTTYCNPAHDFPPQDQTVRFVAEMVQSNAYNNPHTLFLIGTYTIGKEEVFFAPARLCDWRVYVHPQKKRVLDCLGLPAEDQRRLTTEPSASRIHVVPMGMVTFKQMAMTLRMSGGRYKTVVGIRPTGWTFSGGATGSGRSGRAGGGAGRGGQSGVEKALGVTREEKGSCVLYGVPYSEHSSIRELRKLVSMVGADSIVPTVNAGSREQRQELVKLVTSSD